MNVPPVTVPWVSTEPEPRAGPVPQLVGVGNVTRHRVNPQFVDFGRRVVVEQDQFLQRLLLPLAVRQGTA